MRQPLSAATPVARTTFYSHFDNTDEVKNSVEDDLIGKYGNQLTVVMREIL